MKFKTTWYKGPLKSSTNCTLTSVSLQFKRSFIHASDTRGIYIMFDAKYKSNVTIRATSFNGSPLSAWQIDNKTTSDGDIIYRYRGFTELWIVQAPNIDIKITSDPWVMSGFLWWVRIVIWIFTAVRAIQLAMRIFKWGFKTSDIKNHADLYPGFSLRVLIPIMFMLQH